MARHRPQLQGRGRAARLAVPSALRRQDPLQRPAGGAGRGGGVRDRAVRRFAGAGRIRTPRRTPPTCKLEREHAKSRRRTTPTPSRAAMPTKALRAAAGADRGRVSHAGRASQPDGDCSPRRWSGKATASSPSTTRRRACRTAATTSPACSTCRTDDVRVLSPLRRRRVRLRAAPAVPVAARRAGGASRSKRSVRVMLTRQQMFTLGYRPATIQRVALGAERGRHARRDHPRGDRR